MKIFKMCILFLMLMSGLQAETEIEKNCNNYMEDIISNKEKLLNINDNTSPENIKIIKTNAIVISDKAKYLLINCKDIHTKKIEYEKWSAFLISVFKDGLVTEHKIDLMELKNILRKNRISE